VNIRQETQVESISTDLIQRRLRMNTLKNLEMFQYYIPLKGAGETILTGKSLFPF